jgi:hypothetical protein
VLLAGLAVVGWVLVLTQGAGPYDVIAFVRERWPAGPLSCPLCTGAWVGIAVAVVQLAGERWPAVVAPAYVVQLLGAGAALGWIASRALLYVQRATERAEQQAWLARVTAEQIERKSQPDAP